MKSYIIQHDNWNREAPLLTIGNELLKDIIEKDCRQIHKVLMIDHTLQQWYDFQSLKEEELLLVLNTLFTKNELYTFYPN